MIDSNTRIKKFTEDIEVLKKKIDNLITEKNENEKNEENKEENEANMEKENNENNKINKHIVDDEEEE